MSQHFHIRLFPMADRSRAPGAIAALTDKHDTAEQFNGLPLPPAMHKCELHGLWLAKNCVAFFSTSSLLPKHSALKAKAFILTRQICLRRCHQITGPILRHPLAQRRLPYRDTVTWQPAGQRDAHCLLLELFAMLDHLIGLRL